MQVGENSVMKCIALGVIPYWFSSKKARNSLSIRVCWRHWRRSSLQKSHEIDRCFWRVRYFSLPFCFMGVEQFLPLLSYTKVIQFICVSGEVYRNMSVSYWMAYNLQVTSINILNLEAKLNFVQEDWFTSIDVTFRKDS